MTRWYLTFHGGKRHAWNTMHRFELDGRPLGEAVTGDGLPRHVALRELRGFAFGPDGDLYVANAWKDASQVLRFGGTLDGEGRHPFREVFVERHHANPGLSHPFDVAFGPDGHLYVPSQDTSIVGRYFGPLATEGKPGEPMPHPPALRDTDAKRLWPGTIVPSASHTRDGVRAVRRAIFGPDGDLYVADRVAGSINRYDGATGELRRVYRHHHLSTPVHLAFRPGDGALLVGSRDRHAVFAIDTESGAVSMLVTPGAGGLRSPGGLAFDHDGRLYVCSRQTRQVLRFDSEGKPDRKPFIDALKDAPEFIARIDL